jgi:hypothetical protein
MGSRRAVAAILTVGWGACGGTRPAPPADAARTAEADAAIDAPPDASPPDLRDAAAELPRDAPAELRDAAGPERPPSAPGFRPMLPLSTSVIGARMPTFRWSDVDAADYFALELCRDPRCELLTRSFATGLTSFTLETPPPPGAFFWRGRAHLTSGAFLATSVWVSFIGARGAPRDGATLGLPDLDRDGRPDVVIGVAGGPVAVSPWGTTAVPLAPRTLVGPARALAYAGDVNGDGFGDLLVGREGVVDIYHGAPSGPQRVAMMAGDGGLAGLGDVDGDGFGDVLVGAGGSATLYLGGEGGLTPRGTLPFVRFAAAGDFNADGYADAVACGPGARVYFGGPGGLGSAQVLSASAANDCAPAGDVDGDGFADVLVIGAGVTVYYGGETARAPLILPAGTAGAAGDVDGNGFGDVFVASTDGLRLFLGGPGGLTPAAVLPGSTRAAAALGDLDGDGRGELLVAPECGSAQILTGAAGGLGPPLYTFPRPEPCATFLLAR